MVKNINPGAGNSNPVGFFIFNDALFFSATDGTSGDELWKTDGTATGTLMVKNIDPGAGNGISGDYFGPLGPE